MANPIFEWGRAAFKAATGTTVGRVTTTAVVATLTGIGTVRLYKDSRTGNIVGSERVETTVAKNDAQGNVRVKMEGLKDAPKDAEAEKAKAEAEARAAEEAAKAKEAEAAKLEEALKAQREAEEAALLAEQQAQEQGEDNPAGEEQNPDELKDENAEEGDGESEADEDEKGPDSFRGGDETDDLKTDENGEGGDGDGTEGEGENNGEENPEGGQQQTEDEGKDETETGKEKTNTNEQQQENPEGGQQQTEGGEGKDETETGKEKPQDVKGKKEGTTTEGKDGTEGEGREGENNGEENPEGGQQQTEGGESKDETETGKEKPGTNANEQQQENLEGAASGDAPGNDYGNLNSTYRHNNMGLNTSASDSASAVMDTVRAEWKKKFANAKNTDGCPETLASTDLYQLGAVPESGLSKPATGLKWAITAAADEGSTAVKLVVDSSGLLRGDICTAVGEAVGMIGSRDSLFRGDGFEIFVGFDLTPSDISGIRKAAGITGEGGRAEYWDDIAVSFAKTSVYVYRDRKQQTTPAVDPRAEAARERLLKKFRTQEIVNVYVSDYKWAGIAWAVEAAMTDSQSIVRELVFDGIKKAGDDFNQIGVGIAHALSSSGGRPRRDVFAIKVGRDVDIYDDASRALKKEALSGSGASEFFLDFGNYRIFVCRSGEVGEYLNTCLNERFARQDDSGYVYDFELDLWDLITERRGVRLGTGLKEILRLASKPGCKVRELYLREDNNQKSPFFVKGRREEELKEALKDICATEKINANLRIKTNLRWEDGVADLEDKLNALSLPNAVMFDGLSGTISFVVDGLWKVPVIREAVAKWNDGDKQAVLDEFKRWTSKDADWDEVVKKALGESDTPWVYFRQARLQTESIGWAAESDSPVDKLILGEVFRYGLMHEIRKIVERETIHGFTLSAQIKEGDKDISPEKFLEELQHREWWKKRKSDMKLKNGMFVFGNKSSSESGTTTTTPSTGSGTAGAGGVPGAGVAIDEAKLEVLEKEFGLGTPKDFTSIGSWLSVPWIYAYRFFNDCNDRHNGKTPGDLIKDVQVIDAVLDPTSIGFGKDDLVLKATCYYPTGVYADNGRTPNTRNYFVHPWLRDVTKQTVEEKVTVKTTVVRPDGIRVAPGSFDGAVSTHAVQEGEAYLSPNNCIFEITKSGASAWFISEFDPTDRAYNPNGVKFDNTIGKRKIAVHWTFTEDTETVPGDCPSIRALRAIRAGGEAKILPCQFSPNSNERSMDDLNDFLKRAKQDLLLEKLNALKDGELVPAEAFSDLVAEKVCISKIVDKKVFVDVDDVESMGKIIRTMAEYFEVVGDDPDNLPKFAVKGDRLASALNATCADKGICWKKGDDGWFRARSISADLDAATDRDHAFRLQNGMRDDDVFKKAAGTGKDVWLSLSPDFIPSHAAAELFFQKRFSEDAALFERLNLSVVFDDNGLNFWTAFKHEMDKFFSGKGLFVRLDKNNGRVWFDKVDMSENDKAELRTHCPLLSITPEGTLIWTEELMAWLGNPYNKREIFFADLAELTGLKTVDFSKLRRNHTSAYDVLFESYKEETLEQLRVVSGVDFMLPVGVGGEDAFKQDLKDAGFTEAAFKGTNVDENGIMSAKVRETGAPFGVADDELGCNRLIWNGYTRTMLGNALKKDNFFETGREKKLFLKFLTEAVGAKTWEGNEIKCIDFTIGDIPEIHDALKSSEFLQVLKQCNIEGFMLVFNRACFNNDSVSFRMWLDEFRGLGWKIKKMERNGRSALRVEVVGVHKKGKGDPDYAAGIGHNDNDITLTNEFRQAFRDGKFTTEQFCDMLLKYCSEHKAEFKDDEYIEIDLSFYEGGENSNWLDKPSVHEFVDVLVNKLKGWSFSLSKENLAGVFSRGKKAGYEIENKKKERLWVFDVSE